MKFQIVAGELCLDLINTLDNRPVPERLRELLPTYHDLAHWAAEAGAITPARRSALLQLAEHNPRRAESTRLRALELRECLYRMFTRVVHRRPPAPDDLSLFGSFLQEALSNLEVKAGKRQFRLDWRDSDPPLESILWPIVKSASDLLTSPDLEFVRECGAETCRWMFIDRSKNHSRRWCDMKICGNRLKVQRFYRRHPAQARA